MPPRAAQWARKRRRHTVLHAHEDSGNLPIMFRFMAQSPQV
jgi:hypothetical protein